MIKQTVNKHCVSDQYLNTYLWEYVQGRILKANQKEHPRKEKIEVAVFRYHRLNDRVRNGEILKAFFAFIE